MDQYEDITQDHILDDKDDIVYTIAQQQVIHSQEFKTFDHAQALVKLVDHSVNDLKSIKENLRLIDNDFEVILKEVREEILSHSLVDDVFKKLIVDNMSQILDITVDDTQINTDVKIIEDNIEEMRKITSNFNEFINN